jgi:hypothetical protein
VLRYRHLLEAKGRPVAAVVAVEVEPDDRHGKSSYGALNVSLTWPPDFPGARL